MDTFELGKTLCPHLSTQSYHKEGMSLPDGKREQRLDAYWVATDQPAEMAILTVYMKGCVCVCVWCVTVWLCALMYDSVCTPAEHRCHTSSRRPGKLAA